MYDSFFDLIVIGSGPAGEKATAQAAYFGKKEQDCFIDAVFNYPTLSDAYKYAAYDGQGAFARHHVLAERTHYLEEIGRQQAILAAVEDLQEGVAAVMKLRKGMLNKLKSAGPEDKRFVLQCLGARVIVDENGVKEVSVGASPDTDSGVKRSVVCSTPQEYRFSLGATVLN